MLVATLTFLSISYVPVPCGRRDWDGCYHYGTRKIQLRIGSGTHTRQHEIGHAFDHQTMNAYDRQWFTRQTAAEASVSPPERFAEVYATCATRGYMAGHTGAVSTGPYGASYPVRIYRRMCRYLRYHTEGLTWRKS